MKLLKEAYSFKLRRLASEIDINGPEFRGGKQPPLSKYKINELLIPDNMRAKGMECTEDWDGENQIFLDYITQEPFDSKDAEVFVTEVKRAINALAGKLSITEPFTLRLEVRARDGKDRGYISDIISFNSDQSVVSESICYRIFEALEQSDTLIWESSNADAIANIEGNSEHKSISGNVKFYDEGDVVKVEASISGLPQGKTLGFHIHADGDCSGNDEDEFKNVKKHYNPSRKQHPEHAGDMPSLMVDDTGSATLSFTTDRFTVDEIIDKAVIIHSQHDDFESQPAGDAGEKIACGTIHRVDIVESCDNELKCMQDKHKKKQKGMSPFTKLDAGDVEHNVAAFNNAATSISSDGAGIGEAMETREINIRKELNRMDSDIYRDLVNLYDAILISPEDKRKLVDLILKDDAESIEKLLLDIYYSQWSEYADDYPIDSEDDED